MTTPADIDVLILAGGRGERSRSYLGNTPKFLADIDGEPLAAVLIDYLADRGVRRIVLALSGGDGGAERILEWLDDGLEDIDILTSVEPEPRGITSSIIAARPQLLSDPVMIINGDTLLDLDLATVLSRYKPHKLTVVHEGVVSTGCNVLSHSYLMGINDWESQDLLGPLLTTSRPFIDIGTREGYEAACAGTWRR